MFVFEQSNSKQTKTYTAMIGIKLPEFIRMNGTDIIITAPNFEKIRDADGTIFIDTALKTDNHKNIELV